MLAPQMTTRRWMVAVAALAVALGVHEVKKKRDSYLAEALRHSARCAEYRAEAISLAAYEGRYRKPEPTERVEAARFALGGQARGALDEEGAGPGDSIAHLFVLSIGSMIRPDRADRSERARRATEAVMADRRRQVMVDSFRKRAEFARRHAEYHAALGRKFAAAASRPWFPVPPDPPEPR